jgi:quinohemoprotein ethanol dehydrogenase
LNRSFGGALRKLRISILGFLLLFSGFLGILPAAHGASLNWDGPWGNAQNTNSSPQTAIGTSNAANLQVSWLFTFPALPNRQPALVVPGFTDTYQGPGTPPIVHDGIVYQNTQGYDIYAFDAGTGKVVWHKAGLETPDSPAFHVHSLRYYNGMIWETTPGHGWGDVIGLDAFTGDVKVNITDVAKNIPGQRDMYNGKTANLTYTYGPEWAPVFYKNIALVQVATLDFINRGFVSAYDINTGKMLWRWYSVPPAPSCDPDWDFKNLVELGNGTVVNYGQPKGNVQPYKGDWGTNCYLNGAAGPWDNPSIDNETGTFYLQTSSGYPVGTAYTRPGPNLWADSILALDAATGKMKWFYQATTRDLGGEQDCQWSAALISVNGQKEIAVPCRNYFYGLDAATGNLLWSYDPTTVQATGTSPHKFPLIGTNMGNAVNMTAPFIGYPNMVYGLNSSTNENAPAFDGKDTVFYWTSVNQGTCVAGPPSNPSPALSTPPAFNSFGGLRPSCTAAQKAQFKYTPAGSNLVAMNAATGQLKWANHYNATQISNYRGGLTYTNGVVLAGGADGNLRAYDAQTGKLVYMKYMGIALSYAPTIGSTTDGKIMAYLPVGGGLLWGRAPGFLAAFEVPNAAPAGTTSSAAPAGIDPNVFYAVAGLAAILAISTGLLAVKLRKPKR